jgi:dynein heavy chain, axonemal
VKKIISANRLWLTAMPSDGFPVPVLQASVKLTQEPPKGLRANVKRSLIPMTDADLADDSCIAFKEWRKIQFGLKMFHATLQERRKFGPLGFNVRYEFNDSDLECSTVVVRNLLSLDGEVPFDTINFVVGQINYGGRVTLAPKWAH